MKAYFNFRRTMQGAWAISVIYNGYRVEQQYMGYTKGQATALFITHLKTLSN